MEQLLQDLKQQTYKNVYLLCGEEAYLRNQYKKRLKDALVMDGDTMNYSYYEGKDINPRAVIDMAETLPFFADLRVLMLENSGFFKNKCDELADYMSTIPESTCFIFVETEIDKRSRLYKEVKKYGRVVEFGTQKEDTLIKWILGMLKKEGKNVTKETLQAFLTKTGSDMQLIKNELDKLVAYTAERNVITTEDVEHVCITQTTNKIVDMVNAIADGQQKKALELYEDLLSLKEPPMRILFLIARQFHQLYQLKQLSKEGMPGSEIAKLAGIMPFAMKKYQAQAKNFTEEELRAAVEECVASEESVKTGLMNDRLSVELLIMKYSKR
ncbi:MAG: DNA polymerase III subunit delta [Lachnospiraceae bacterium]|nr:DNA polymerase III subunit delta [Lachnospiraceae bacterium]